jgi:hypothetical protein
MKFETLHKLILENFNRYYHITPSKNVRKILKRGLLPSIGDRSKKIPEELPAIYLFNNLNDLEDAVMNWLADEFNEDEELTALIISIPENNSENIIIHHDGLSSVSYDPIPAKYISVSDIEI